MQAFAMFFLAAAAVGGIAWVFVYPFLSGERTAERRMANVTKVEPVVRTKRVQARSRRDEIEGTLKEIEQRRKKERRVTLTVRLARAGLDWSKRRFVITAASIGIAFFAVLTFTGAGLLPSMGMAFAGAFGLPFWMLAYL